MYIGFIEIYGVDPLVVYLFLAVCVSAILYFFGINPLKGLGGKPEDEQIIMPHEEASKTVQTWIEGKVWQGYLESREVVEIDPITNRKKVKINYEDGRSEICYADQLEPIDRENSILNLDVTAWKIIDDDDKEREMYEKQKLKFANQILMKENLDYNKDYTKKIDEIGDLVKSFRGKTNPGFTQGFGGSSYRRGYSGYQTQEEDDSS